MNKERWYDRDLPWYVIAVAAIYFACHIVAAMMRGRL